MHKFFIQFIAVMLVTISLSAQAKVLLPQSSFTEVEGFDSPRSFTVSSDGQYQFLLAEQGVITVLKQSAGTDSYSVHDIVDISHLGELGLRERLVASPDSRFLYVCAFDQSIATFSINESGDPLTFVRFEPVTSIYQYHGCAISNDGSELMLGKQNGLHVFDRDVDTGALTQSQMVEVDFLDRESLTLVHDIAFSPDNRYI